MAYSATVTTNYNPLNIRSGPGKNYSVKGTIPKGANITIYGVQKDGDWSWGTVNYNGIQGWVCIHEAGVGQNWVKVDTSSKANNTTTSPTWQYASAGTDPVADLVEEEGTSTGLDSFLTELMNISVNNGKLLKASTRMFGMPFQYANFIDCRINNVSPTLGRKYIENIVLPAPILTIIPGKPVYLPGAKNKRNTAHALVSAANGNFGELAALGKDLGIENLRWFDFQQTYNEYMMYVNALCRVGACFLEIGDAQFNGTKLSAYNWKNYRYTEESYKSTFTGLIKSGGAVGKSMLDSLKSLGGKALTKLKNVLSIGDNETSNGILFNDEEEDTEGLLDTLDSLLANMNFVQFYIDPSASSFNDSNSNSTSSSKLEGLFDKGSDMLKELAFIANAGGVDAASLQEFGDKSLDALTDNILKGNSGVTAFMQRITSGLSTVVKGENMIIPEIYQRSDYTKSYSITIRLVSPCNDKLSYYINVFVPLMHLLALAIPKQGTANTYAAPFIIKGYLPGVFSCNLGIIESLAIDKSNTTTVDGLATEVKVTINIKDLYSDLMMTPSNKPLLLLSNTSLIDYIAVNCGLDLVMPQMSKKLDYIMNAVKTAFTDIPDNLVSQMTEKIDNVVSAWTHL